MIGSPLVTLVWWKAALIRALRTALVVAVPYVPVSYNNHVPYITVAAAAAFGFVASLITSLVQLPEASGRAVPWWLAVLTRVVKTTAQAAIASFGTSVLITQIHWVTTLQVVGTAAFGSLLLALISNLPETTPPTIQGGALVRTLGPADTAAVVADIPFPTPAISGSSATATALIQDIPTTRIADLPSRDSMAGGV